MKFSPPLKQGFLIKRYKRFLADIQDDNGDTLTIHCPNTGSMKNCLVPGAPIWYSVSESKKRKYPHTWELATTPDGDVAGINTHNANRLVAEAIATGMIPHLLNPSDIRTEVKYGMENSRIDFLVTVQQRQWYVEVKNVTLKDDGVGCFPDAVSARGTKHLRELTAMAQAGEKALLVYCVQHSGITHVMPAAHIDPAYAQAYLRAVTAGVQVIALKATMNASEIALREVIPVAMNSRDKLNTVYKLNTGYKLKP